MITNEALGKHVGIGWVCEQLDLNLRKDVMVFGDGENDLGMFQVSGVGGDRVGSVTSECDQ